MCMAKSLGSFWLEGSGKPPTFDLQNVAPAFPNPHPEGWGAFGSCLQRRCRQFPESPTRKGGVLSDSAYRAGAALSRIPHPEGWGTFGSGLQRRRRHFPESPTRKGGVLSDSAYSAGAPLFRIPHPEGWGIFGSGPQRRRRHFPEYPTRKGGVLPGVREELV
jgi:hypothetical protein